MMSNVQWAMDYPMNLNPMSRLWEKFSSKAMVQIMGSMEDERIFSTMTFMRQNCRIGFMNIWI